MLFCALVNHNQAMGMHVSSGVYVMRSIGCIKEIPNFICVHYKCVRRFVAKQFLQRRLPDVSSSIGIPPQNVSNACNVGGLINEINGFSRIEWVIKANSMVNIVKFKQTHTFSFCANNFHYLFAITHSLVTTYTSTYMRWKLFLLDSRCERDMNKTKQKLHAYVASREMRV